MWSVHTRGAGGGSCRLPLSSVSDASLSGVRDWEKVLTLPLVSEALCPSRLRHRVERKKSPAVVKKVAFGCQTQRLRNADALRGGVARC